MINAENYKNIYENGPESVETIFFVVSPHFLSNNLYSSVALPLQSSL